VSSHAAVALVIVGLVLAVIGTLRVATDRYDVQLPVINRPWTLIGASGAVVALALLLAATVAIAAAGTFCSWPQSATTLSGLGVIVSVLPALVAIRETLRHERRSVAYWLMVGAVISAVGLYMWLLTGANHPCPGGFVSDLLN
jgi:drug/metabolite transporter (DMT)-like permease